MTVSSIAALLGAFTAVLTAEELLLQADVPALADETRAIIETVRAKARDAIEAAAQAPGDALDRLTLLDHAVDLEGTDSPLVLRIMQVLAATASAPAPATALVG